MEGKGSLFKKKPKFSVVLLVAFIALFMVAGIYVVYRMLGATFDLSTADVYKADGKVINRISSTNRYGTAVAFSNLRKPTNGSGGAVILTDGTNWPDAAVASSLSGAYNAPILLTPPTSLSNESLTEMQRIKPTKIIVLGSTSAVSESIVSALKNHFPSATHVRIAGRDRYETAAKIAAEVKAKTIADGKAWEGKAFVVSGTAYPDALTVGTVAANRKWPILYSDTSLNGHTKAALTSLGVTKTYVVGGTPAVSASTFSALPAPTRIYGADRYLTAIEFAKWAKTNITGFSYKTVGVANGLDFPDALTGSAYLGTLSTPAPLLISAPSGTTSTYNFIDSNKAAIYTVDAFGGTTSIAATTLKNFAIKLGILQDAKQAEAQRILETYIAKYKYLEGTTVEFGDARGYQAICYYQNKRIVISPTHTSSLDRIIGHEIWHIIDWWHDGVITWGENVPPRAGTGPYLK